MTNTSFCEDNFTNFLLHIPNIKPTHPLYEKMKNKGAYLILRNDRDEFVLLDAQNSEPDWSREDGITHVTSGNSVKEVIEKFKRINANIKGIAVYDKKERFKFKLIDFDKIDSICSE